MMESKLKVLLGNLLKECSDAFANNGCNDINSNYYNGWSESQLKEFNHKLNVYNGISDIEDEQYVENAYNYDWWVMRYFADMLLNQ